MSTKIGSRHQHHSIAKRQAAVTPKAPAKTAKAGQKTPVKTESKGSWLKPGSDGHIRKSGQSSFEHKNQWGKKVGDQSYKQNTSGPKVNKQIGKLLDKGPQRTFEGSIDKSKTLKTGQGTFSNKSGSVTGSGDYKVGVNANANGKLKVGLNGVHGSGRAEAGITAEAKGQVKLGKGPVRGEINGKVSAGAKVKADGSITIDPKKGTYHAKVGGEAFAGVKASVDGKVRLGKHATVGGHAEAQAGIGVSAHAEAGIQNGRLKFKASFGAALGIGGKVGFNADINVKPVLDVVNKGKALVSGGIDKAKEIGNNVKNFFKKFW
jgi:hypothetical protein